MSSKESSIIAMVKELEIGEQEHKSIPEEGGKILQVGPTRRSLTMLMTSCRKSTIINEQYLHSPKEDYLPPK